MSEVKQQTNLFSRIMDAVMENRANFHLEHPETQGGFINIINFYGDLIEYLLPKVVEKDILHEKIKVSFLTFKNILAAYYLLESGFIIDDWLPLTRKAIEYSLIGIDINSNHESMEEWGKSIEQCLGEVNDFYFAKDRVIKRIREMPCYPNEDKSIAEFLLRQWKLMSSLGVHAFAASQTKGHFANDSIGMIFASENAELNKRLHLFSKIIFNSIVILTGDHCLLELLSRDKNLGKRYAILRIEQSETVEELRRAIQAAPTEFQSLKNVDESLRSLKSVENVNVYYDDKRSSYYLSITSKGE